MCPPVQSHPLIKSRLSFKKGLYKPTESHLLHVINLLPRTWKQSQSTFTFVNLIVKISAEILTICAYPEKRGPQYYIKLDYFPRGNPRAN